MSRARATTALGIAAAGVLALAFLGLTGFAWNDYDDEASRPVAALVAGDAHTFLTTAPAYGGSLLLRSPFAFLASAWGGGELAVYRMLALPCLAAAAVLGLVLLRLRDRRLPAAGWGLLVVALAAANPITLRALEIGHPEELLGAALCVLAVLAALAERPYAAALLLGLAMANKAWAVLAIGPVLLALGDRRWRALVLAGAVAALFTAPFVLAGAASHGVGTVSSTSTIFQPWQVWWFLGETGFEVRGVDGMIKPDYRVPPGWLAQITHPLIAVLWIPAGIAWIRRRGRGAAGTDVLLLLALLFLLRCVLDPWNNVYYHLPFLLALLAWESVRRAQPPVLAVSATALTWVTFQELPGVVSPDVQSLAYLAWAVPLVLWMAAVTFRVAPQRRSRSVPAALRASA